jgi:GNAT superfamily N-acetyltransferase
VLIREGTFEECVNLSKKIMDFESPYEINEYKKRCETVTHLPLIADMDNKQIGFKIGYDRYKDGSFYSWMGGVLPEFRQKKVASKLADFQENWALKNGYISIQLKTRKKHKAMIDFSLKRNFLIIDKKPMDDPLETRIIMEKQLN